MENENQPSLFTTQPDVQGRAIYPLHTKIVIVKGNF